jgi:dienelactone hydrolase
MDNMIAPTSRRLCLLILAALSASARADVQTKTIEYSVGGTTCEGFLAYDDAKTGARPGVVVVHQWKGLTDYEKTRARMLAQLGYTAFCADIYGKGVRPTEVKDAAAQAGKFKDDRALYRQRLMAALEVLKKQPQTNTKELAAIGYCFGGTGALELARSGAAVRGVVSFHGALATPSPADAKNIKCRVLALHGADDPFVPPAEVEAFKKEMADAGVKYELIAYPGAVHGFTQWDAGSDKSKGFAYDKAADEKSWDAMKKFFKELLH